MRFRKPILRPMFFVLATALVLAGGGCQTLHTDFASLFTDVPDQPASTEATAAKKEETPNYFIEFRPDSGKPTLVPRPLTDVTYVQQALEQSNALKKFRRSKIEIYRVLPKGGGHKIPVNYDRRKKRVDPGTDYAIHPNDRLVVTEDTSTILDDMLEKLGI